jgi:hypothetical protein
MCDGTREVLEAMKKEIMDMYGPEEGCYSVLGPGKSCYDHYGEASSSQS